MDGYIQIRAFHAGDLCAVYDLEQDVFGAHAYPRYFFRQAYDIFSDLFRVAENEQGEPVGYIMGALETGALDGWIVSMAVMKEYRRMGIALMLMESVLHLLSERGAHNVLLTVDPDNEEAVALYQKAGFHEIRRDDNYFGPGAARIVMRRDLEAL